MPDSLETRIVSHAASRVPSFRLFSDYYRHYETVLAKSPSAREECFRIRYEVYCVEREFLDAGESPDQIERDTYDEHSEHALLIERASGTAIGTIRLVLHKPGSLIGSLPFHAVCKDPAANDPLTLPFRKTAEVSRLAIARWRSKTAYAGHNGAKATEIPLKKYVAMGLLKMAVEIAVNNGVQYLCAVAEPSLLRLWSLCGIHLEELGPRVDYHGERQPCYSHLATLLDGIYADRPDIWEIITDLGRLYPGRQTHRMQAHTKFKQFEMT